MKKKLLLGVLLLTMALSLVACGSDSKSDSKNKKSNKATVQDDDKDDDDKKDDDTKTNDLKSSTVEDFYGAERDITADIVATGLDCSAYDTITLVCSGNDVTYEYKVKEGYTLTVDEAQIAESLEPQGPVSMTSIEAECGVRPDSITWSYLNSDGSVAGSYTYVE